MSTLYRPRNRSYGLQCHTTDSASPVSFHSTGKGLLSDTLCLFGTLCAPFRLHHISQSVPLSRHARLVLAGIQFVKHPFPCATIREATGLATGECQDTAARLLLSSRPYALRTKPSVPGRRVVLTDSRAHAGGGHCWPSTLNAERRRPAATPLSCRDWYLGASRAARMRRRASAWLPLSAVPSARLLARSLLRHSSFVASHVVRRLTGSFPLLHPVTPLPLAPCDALKLRPRLLRPLPSSRLPPAGQIPAVPALLALPVHLSQPG